MARDPPPESASPTFLGFWRRGPSCVVAAVFRSIRMKFLSDSVVLNACAPRIGSSGFPERIRIKQVLRAETGSARSCATASMSISLGCGEDEGWVCQLPTQSTDPRNRSRLLSAASIIPLTPQVKCSSLASLSGGGPSTSVTQSTPAASFNSPNTSPPVSIPGPTVRADRLAHPRISRAAVADTRTE